MDLLRSAYQSTARSVRTVVSGQKNRFVDDTFNLDLCYVTDRIIAMSIHSDDWDSLWRNSSTELAAFFEKNHPGHCRVFNLTEKAYDTTIFNDEVSHCGWLDHFAPPFPLLCEIMNEIDQWLAKDPENVAAIHCKAGKGRTGTVVASYLLHSKVCPDTDSAVELFKSKRFKAKGGIEIPSQLRYIDYYNQVLNGTVTHEQVNNPPTLKLQQIVVHTIPELGLVQKGCQLTIELYQDVHRGYDKAPLFIGVSPRVLPGSQNEIQFDCPANTPMSSDISMVVYNTTLLGRSVIFRASFNTLFVTGNTMTMSADELDNEQSGKYSMKGDSSYHPDFKVTIQFV